jgi:hypothetical protein
MALGLFDAERAERWGKDAGEREEKEDVGAGQIGGHGGLLYLLSHADLVLSVLTRQGPRALAGATIVMDGNVFTNVQIIHNMESDSKFVRKRRRRGCGQFRSKLYQMLAAFGI